MHTWYHASMNELATANWYENLAKPFFAPPSWIFGPVWAFLYVLIAISFSYIIYKVLNGEWSYTLLAITVANLLSNALFSPLQFTFKNNTLALIDIFVVLISLIVLIRMVYPLNKIIAYMQIPYLLWVSFATLLQISITYLNW